MALSVVQRMASEAVLMWEGQGGMAEVQLGLVVFT